ncbi:hypothetical protein [Streptomyces halobius]|uniref:Uncharacterized protein n=1 Tax=Streptomyces halobius TaxID=2879846 RepID=A0ABY4MBP4_9ACTN|nr:hypothetical protein [Streptomyces halobius]UQA94543.1 hypothetical protein K9S39_24160 [Streptomyces halobius]
MINGLRRLGGGVVMAAGIGLGVWLVFGPAHDWEGNMRLVKLVLGLAATGAITGGARLIFWDPKGEASPAAVDRA